MKKIKTPTGKRLWSASRGWVAFDDNDIPIPVVPEAMARAIVMVEDEARPAPLNIAAGVAIAALLLLFIVAIVTALDSGRFRAIPNCHDTQVLYGTGEFSGGPDDLGRYEEYICGPLPRP